MFLEWPGRSLWWEMDVQAHFSRGRIQCFSPAFFEDHPNCLPREQRQSWSTHLLPSCMNGAVISPFFIHPGITHGEKAQSLISLRKEENKTLFFSEISLVANRKLFITRAPAENASSRGWRSCLSCPVIYPLAFVFCDIDSAGPAIHNTHG